MTMTCCPLSSGDGYRPACFSSTTPVARHEHQCCECRETIPKGAMYERHQGKWDDGWSTFVTCLSCVEIRKHFACDGWIYEQLWQDLEDNFYPDHGNMVGGMKPIVDAMVNLGLLVDDDPTHASITYSQTPLDKDGYFDPALLVRIGEGLA